MDRSPGKVKNESGDSWNTGLPSQDSTQASPSAGRALRRQEPQTLTLSVAITTAGWTLLMT